MGFLEFIQRIIAFFMLKSAVGFVILSFVSASTGWLGLILGIGCLFISHSFIKIARFPFVNRYNNGFWVW